MNVNDYIRADGIVGRVKEIGGTKIIIEVADGKELSLESSEDVLTDSKIINLVEVGDYINGFPVVEISTFKALDGEEQRYLRLNRFEYLVAIYNKDIETFMTKEDMERYSFYAKGEPDV